MCGYGSSGDLVIRFAPQARGQKRLVIEAMGLPSRGGTKGANGMIREARPGIGGQVSAAVGTNDHIDGDRVSFQRRQLGCHGQTQTG